MTPAHIEPALGGREREVPLTTAWQHAQQVLTQRGWQAQLQAAEPAGEFAAWCCQLVDATGAGLPGGAGAGKGAHEAARAGAVFEALEHHLLQRGDRGPARLHAAGLVANGFDGDVLAPLLAEQPTAPLACQDYYSLTSEDTLTVPLGLARPSYVADAAARARLGDRFDYTALEPYITNNGSALGNTLAEATLHAVNELIERDALSLLLCRAFLGTGYRPRLLELASLPDELARLYTHTHTVLGRPPWLLEITTDLGVPTILAYLPPDPKRSQHGRGLGTSLNPHYATYRAMSELLQNELLADRPEPEQLHPLAEIDPVLLDCAAFDLTTHLETGTDRCALPPEEPQESVPAQVATVLTALEDRGIRPYRRILDIGTEALTVVHLLIPGLERIMTLLQGHPALPGPRGLHAASPTPAATTEKATTPAPSSHHPESADTLLGGPAAHTQR